MEKVKKRKKSELLLNIATNLVLGMIIVSIGFLCLFPTTDTVVVEGGDSNLYRRGKSEDGVSIMFNVYEGKDVIFSILDTLDEYAAKATFFIGGAWADDNPAMLKEILARGHELGNHGYFHRDHASMNEAKNLEEIRSCNEYIKAVTGKEVTLFAPPSGAYNAATLLAAKRLNMKTILWSKDTIDWRDQKASIIYSRATNNILAGDLVLMHPKKSTAIALKDILKYYKNRGLRVITVSENLGLGG